MKLHDSIFIFETEEDLSKFWNELLNNSPDKSEIIGNMFIVSKAKWKHRLIKWLFT